MLYTTRLIPHTAQHSLRVPRTRGFTLLEMVVSVGIFSIVMVIATGAFLTLISLDRKERATNDVVTNLSFAMDSVTRAIRTGGSYQCGGVGGGDCWPNGQHEFAFVDNNGQVQDISVSNNQIVQRTNGGIAVPLTDPRITILASDLTFFVRGTLPGIADDTQPRVTISVHGSMTPDSKTAPIDFTIQTSATQRRIDL